MSDNSNALTLADWTTDADSVGEWQRQIYKHTDCGAWLSVHVPGIGWVHKGADAARALGPDTLIDYVMVGSIVEGCDYGTGEVEVKSPADFDAAIAEVEDEARSIWNDTHGCDTCGAHWVAECGTADCGEYGGRPVWEDCPYCRGHGIII